MGTSRMRSASGALQATRSLRRSVRGDSVPADSSGQRSGKRAVPLWVREDTVSILQSQTAGPFMAENTDVHVTSQTHRA